MSSPDRKRSQNVPRGSIFQLPAPNISYDEKCVIPPRFRRPCSGYDILTSYRALNCTSKFTTALRGFPATERLFCWFLPDTYACNNDDSDDDDDDDEAGDCTDCYHGYSRFYTQSIDLLNLIKLI